MLPFMKVSLPTPTKHTTPWEGSSGSPLRLTGEKPSLMSVASAQGAERPLASASKAARWDESHGSWLLRHLLILFCVAAFSIPAYYLTSRFVVTAVIIQGRSMTPTLQDGERYYLNRWRYLFVAPDRGDLVVIKDPGHSDYAVKRIVGKPNDWLNIRDGKIFLNGRRLDEPYLASGTLTDVPDHKEKWIQLGEDQYYVLGDNRKASEDSRYYGVVRREHILGLLVK
jgi:signal peptidase I